MRIERISTERWDELAKALADSRSDEQKPKPEHSIILGAFDGDRLVGCIGAEKTWLVSPFWVQKDYRGKGLASELARQLATHNTERLREVCATTNAHVERLIFTLGFKPIQGQIWRRDVG